MRKKLAFLIAPVILFAIFCFAISELGVQGHLVNPFLREKFYPGLSRATGLLTDLKFHFRGSHPIKNPIVVVEIDGPSVERFGRWPWHRDLTAYLIEKVLLAGAKVVGIDIVFAEPDPRVPPELKELLQKKKLDVLAESFETDPLLKKVIQNYSDRLVLGWATDMACQPLYEDPQYCPVMDPEALKQFPPEFAKFSLNDFVLPKGVVFQPQRTPMLSYVTPLANLPEYNQVAKYSGYFSAVLDADGFIRRSNLFGLGAGQPYPSLALEMARVGLKDRVEIQLNGSQRTQDIRFVSTQKSIPVTPLGVMEINFRGPTSVFPHLTAEEILTEPDPDQNNLNKASASSKKTDILKDAYVLIGLSAIGVFDMRQFPFETNAAGVYGHAYILENLLSGDPILPGSSHLGSIWILLLMTVGVILFAYGVQQLNAAPALILAFTVFSGLFVFDFKVLFSKNVNWNTVFLYLELGVVFILTLALKYLQEERNKSFVRNAFAKYVPATVVDSILKDPSKLSLGGEKKEVTILFSDIRGFTNFSESLDAKALTSFLNDYLGIMTGLVFSHQGTLDKYIGDAVMAFWGAPLEQKDHASNACQAAIQMIVELKKHKERFKQVYGLDVNIGIGINSGIVSVGNMGSEQNFEYTVIGDNVNLASRLEGITKFYNVPIATTRFTLDSIRQAGGVEPKFRILDFVRVKGKKNVVEILQILDEEYPPELLNCFSEGRKQFLEKNWTGAIRQFEMANQISQKTFGRDDGPSMLAISRCKTFIHTPPEEDWDGSLEMRSK